MPAPRSAVATAAVLILCLGACATPGGASRGGPDESAVSVPADSGGCRPLFAADPDEAAPRSCWNRAWEVPAAIVAVPVVIGVLVGAATAPVWVPLVLWLK